MNPLVIQGLFAAGMSLIERFFPDPEKKAAAQLELLRMQQTGDLAQLAASTDLAKLQIQTNVEEAKSPHLFVAGWRPAIGWICAIALFWNFLGYPMAVWVAEYWKPEFTPPALLEDNLMELVLGMLGLGGLRTWEKIKGVQS